MLPRVTGVSRPWRRVACIAGLLACLALSGCSLGLKLAYEHLDWLASRRLNELVELTDTQQRTFDQAFASLWQWHRQTELPVYARWLQNLAKNAGNDLGETRIVTLQQELDQMYRRTLQQALPGLAMVLASLSDKQVDTVQESLADRNAKYRKKYIAPDTGQRRENLLKANRKSLKRWLGRLNPAQQQRIERWASEHEDLSESWLEARQAWQARFIRTLQERQHAAFPAQLGDVLSRREADWTATHRATFERNQARWLAMLQDMLALADADQRAHLTERLNDYADALLELAQQVHPAPDRDT